MSSRELNSSTRNTYPYNAIVHLIVEFPGGLTSGTGALVGKNDILTATHVLYSPELGGYPTKIWVALGADWNGVKGAYDEIPKSYSIYNRGEFGGIAYPSEVFMDTSHTTVRGIEAQNDVAIIALPDPIGLETGWFSMASGRDTPRTANSVGYPGTGTGMMYEQVRVVAHPYLDIYYANTEVMSEGASGGPLFDSDNHIIGVRSAGSSNSATWADLDLHYNELVKYITSNDHYLDKNRIVTLNATASVADEGEEISFTLFDSTSVSGEQVRYEMSGLNSSDISLANLSGYLTFGNDGFATLLIKIAKDNRTEGRETLIFMSSGKVLEVVINDTSTMQNQQETLITDVSPPRNLDGSSVRSILRKVIVAYDSSVYVAGETDSDSLGRLYDHAKQSLFVSRHSSEGELLWSKSFGSYEFDFIRGAVVDSTDNIYILSKIGSWAPGRPEIGYNDVLLTKLNNEGVLIWEKVFGSTNKDLPLDLHLGPDGMLNLVYGEEAEFDYLEPNGHSTAPSKLLKVDQDGNAQSSFDTTLENRLWSEIPSNFIVSFDGSTIFIGDAQESTEANRLSSYGQNGDLQWKVPLLFNVPYKATKADVKLTQASPNIDVPTFERTMAYSYYTPNVPTSERIVPMALGIDGSIYVTGIWRWTKNVIQKYSSDGALSWEKAFGYTSGSYSADSIAVSLNGNIFIAGNGYGGGFYDIPARAGNHVWYVSFDQDGNNLSSGAFDGVWTSSITVSQNGDVLLGITDYGGSLNYTKIHSTENNPASAVIENSQSMITEGGTAQFKITSTNLAEGTEIGYGVWISAGEVLSTKGVVTLDVNGEALINVTSLVDNQYDIDTSLVVTTMFGSSGIFVRDTTPLSGDENYAIRSDDISQQAYRIYEAAFGRAPDPRGLGYWISQFDDGMGLIEISSRFIDSNEFKSIYGTNPTNETFITKLYLNVLDRVPDNSGLDWWVDQLDNNSEKTWKKVLADFSESPENIENNRLELVGGVEYISYDVA